jgi:hypothetical protein
LTDLCQAQQNIKKGKCSHEGVQELQEERRQALHAPFHGMIGILAYLLLDESGDR